jgi:hypothetical protein
MGRPRNEDRQSPELPRAYTDTGIAERQESQLQPTPGLYVIKDEWNGSLEQGNPFTDTAKPYVDANPDKRFRFIGEKQTERTGKRGYRDVINPETNKPVEVGRLRLGYIPEDEARRREADRLDKNRTLQQRTREEGRERMEKIARDAGLTSKDARPLERGEIVAEIPSR